MALMVKALQNLPNLQKVHLRSYPRDTTAILRTHCVGQDWDAPWGWRHLQGAMIAEIGARDSTKYFLGSNEVFFEDKNWSNWHLQPIFEALSTIQDRPDWTLTFDLNSSEPHIQDIDQCGNTPGIPFDVDLESWKACKHRIRKIIIHRTLINDGRPHRARLEWLMKLFKSCGMNVEVFRCDNSTYWAKICNRALLPRLRHLEVTTSIFRDCYFREFLIAHRETLETMKLDGADLSLYEGEADNDASWVAQFALILKLPRLRHIDLRDLSWWTNGRILEDWRTVKDEEPGWNDALVAQNEEIYVVLKRAIKNNAVSWTPRGVEYEPYRNYQRGPWVVFGQETNVTPAVQESEQIAMETLDKI